MQLTVRDAARILQVSDRTIHRWIRDEGLPAEQLDGRFRFNRAELLEWAITRKLRVSDELFRANGDPPRPLPGLAISLEAGGVSHGVRGAAKGDVLRAVVGALPLPEGMDTEWLVRLLLAREALGSTAVGEGIALPHVRNPIVLRVRIPAVNLSFLESPLDFGAPDGQPVHTLFTLVSPTVRDHLHLLSQLTRALRDPDFKQAVSRREAREEILAAARRAESRGIPGGSPATGAAR